MSGSCDTHSAMRAEYRCDGCGKALCSACVEQGSHLDFCRHCGERAVSLAADLEMASEASAPSGASGEAAGTLWSPVEGTVEEPLGNDPDTSGAVAGTLWTPPFEDTSAGSSAAARLGYGPLFLLTEHVVVPAAVIGMVASLLFYLLDVRAIFLAGGGALKQIGLCFVAGTVLIARYGKTSADAERQTWYTAALALATVLAMVVSPWEDPVDGWLGPVLNLLIIFAVWRFATRLTDSLNLGPLERARPRRLYGLDRLEIEAELERRGEAIGTRPAKAEAADAHGNPSARVAKLAVIALLTFALGEPAILAGPPEVGERALAAVVVFLLSTGMVLAAGSAIGTLQATQPPRRWVDEGVLPARVGTAACLAVLALAAGLAAPGLDYRGDGRLSPERGLEATDLEGAAGEDGDGDGASRPGDGSNPGREGEGQGRGEPRGGAGGTAGSLLGALSALGRWLFWPFVALVTLVGLFFLWRFLQRSGVGFGKGLLSSLWERLRAMLSGLWPAGRPRTTERVFHGDPLAGLDHLHSLAASAAVLESYLRLQAALAAMGYPRSPESTPLEHAAGLPAPLRTIVEPVAQLHARAAYGGERLTEQDRGRALDALDALRQERDSRQAA